jgi:uncharacterized membrane protein
MTYCSKCGAAVEGRFCASCGTAVGSAADPSPHPTPAGATNVPLADNVASTLCYLLMGITGLLFLVLEPYNQKRSIRFHAFQSIFVTVALTLAWMILFTIGIVLAAIPFVGAMLAGLLFMALSIGAFIVWLLLMYKTYNNEKLVLPFIGALAEKQA